MQDITGAQGTGGAARRSLEEKSMLVREIHHRVKNNLQMIVSLLNLQSRAYAGPAGARGVRRDRGRVRAIAHIHEQLYASDDLREVEFGAYLTALAGELVAFTSSRPGAVAFDLHVQNMVLTIEKAIPLGLIANELIVNSLKHGLRNRKGRIEVRLSYRPESIEPESGQTLDEAWACLEVRDDGPGYAPGFNVAEAQTMGLRLINLLVGQLRGTLDVHRNGGAGVSVGFPINLMSEQP